MKKLVRDTACKARLYRQLRWLSRHIIHRDELRREKQELRLYKKIIKKDDLVFDVGANVGEKTRQFLKLGARVVAFEPQKDCLRELISRYNCKNLHTESLALGSKTETRKFYVRRHRGGSGFYKKWGNDIEKEIDINIATLDEMLLIYGKPAFIKIDTEGFELEVLKGLTSKVRFISIEYHLDAQGIKKTIDCVNYLSKLGHIRLNIAPTKNTMFAFERWISKEKFLEVFPDKVAELPNFAGYGDLFISTI